MVGVSLFGVDPLIFVFRKLMLPLQNDWDVFSNLFQDYHWR